MGGDTSTRPQAGFGRAGERASSTGGRALDDAGRAKPDLKGRARLAEKGRQCSGPPWTGEETASETLVTHMLRVRVVLRWPKRLAGILRNTVTTLIFLIDAESTISRIVRTSNQTCHAAH
jgi:hypothetical protein